MNTKESRKALVSREQIDQAILSGSSAKQAIADKLLDCLNEKRDTYDCIIDPISYVIETDDKELTKLIKSILTQSILSTPMKYAGRMFLSKCIDRLTKERPQFVADLCDDLIRTSRGSNRAFQQSQIRALKYLRKVEQETRKSMTSIPQSELESICRDALLYGDEECKIDTLNMILETRITTKPLEESDLDAYKLTFQDALNLHQPSLRQMYLAASNKLLARLKDSSRVVMRGKYDDSGKHTIQRRYVQFLDWLIESCLNSIYCNAYFGSFILTMSILKLVIKYVSFEDPNLPIKSHFENRKCYDSILSCLTDSFEENRTLALELLLLLPANETFLEDKNLNYLEQIAYDLVNRVNPAHTLTCQYILKLVIGLRLKKDTNSTGNELLLFHLEKLLKLVEDGIEKTRENLLVAMKDNAIYPKLSCIRALLDEIDVAGTIQDREQWQQLADRIVNASIEACQAVSTIVCNLNPETMGHLPMDLKPLDAEGLSKLLNVSLSIDPAQMSTITSQMLLISGWKTIKECSLSMGILCTHLWWPRERIKAKREKFPALEGEPILRSDKIRKIIDFFDHYLRNLRHRGAFEQAYNGFLMVTKRVWHEPEYRALLMKTLEEIMVDFRVKQGPSDEKKVEYLKAYVTRRSAGLPFIVQAILNSEHKDQSEALVRVMGCLFEVLDNVKSETYQKIHCLNILRALIKDSSLGEKVVPYIGKTFEVTLESFRSESFSIRNCANMLLKATVDRTFGVNRLRDDIHMQNKLSFEKFFTECPEIREQMLRHLRDGVRDRNCLAAVHSVFILLFRLRPSLNPSPNFDYNTAIKPFIEPIQDLTFTCPDFKLRELAAKLLVRLVMCCNRSNDYSWFEKHILELTKLCAVSDLDLVDDRNAIHGALLLLKNWILSLNSEEHVELQDKAINAAKVIFKEIFKKAEFENSIPKCAIAVATLDVVEACCLVRPNQENMWIHPLIHCSYMHCSPSGNELMANVLFKSISVFALSRCNSHPTAAQDFLDLFTSHGWAPLQRVFNVDFQAGILRLFRQIMFNEDEESYLERLLDRLDIDPSATFPTPYDIRNSLLENGKERERWSKYCAQPELKSKLKKIWRYEVPMQVPYEQQQTFCSRINNTPRAREFLALYIKQKVDLHERVHSLHRLKFWLEMIEGLPDCDIKSLVLLCANSAFICGCSNLCEITASSYVMRKFSSALEELADGHHDPLIRQTCFEALKLSLPRAAKQSHYLMRDKSLINLVSAFIKLRQDEDYEIRNIEFSSFSDMIDIPMPRDMVANKSPIVVREQILAAIRLTAKLESYEMQRTGVAQSSACRITTELVMRIIFNHSKNYATTIHEERELLFDKTKLNTFADHVSTVEGAIDSLEKMYQEYPPIHINDLELSPDVLRELATINRAVQSKEGDYNWRLKGSVFDYLASDTGRPSGCGSANTIVFNQALHNVLESLNYFEIGYLSMLVDTDYPYHELSLFKRLAFILFVCKNTSNDLDLSKVLDIQDRLQRIIEHCCATTILCKCSAMIQTVTSDTVRFHRRSDSRS